MFSIGAGKCQAPFYLREVSKLLDQVIEVIRVVVESWGGGDEGTCSVVSNKNPAQF